MTGSKTNTMTREEVLAAIRNIPESTHFVWDGIDEDERPLTKEELLAGINAMEVRRGRPSGSEKTQIALHVDNRVLEAFRAMGNGWQTKMNDALKEWLKEHTV